VPRLTLLFFGTAKDVPEAAKMVTAETACLYYERFRSASQRPKRWRARHCTSSEGHALFQQIRYRRRPE